MRHWVHRTLCRIATALCLLSAALIGGVLGYCGGWIVGLLLVGMGAILITVSPGEPEPGWLLGCCYLVFPLVYYAMPMAGAVFGSWTCAQALKRAAADREHPRPMAAPGDGG